MEPPRIAWAITGAGHALEECVDALLGCGRADLFLTPAAEEVLEAYGLSARIRAAGLGACRGRAASAPEACRFSSGRYRVLVVAPATANSVAKFVCGIADNLVTNLYAQAGKSRVPVIVYPTDLAPEMDSFGPGRRRVRVYPRAVDLDNARKLEGCAGTRVVRSREELERCLAACL